MNIISSILCISMLVIYNSEANSNSVFDDIDDDRPVSLEGIITFTSGVSVNFALLANEGVPWPCRLDGKLNGPKVDLRCRDVKKIIFNDSAATYDFQYPGRITVINHADKTYYMENVEFLGSEWPGEIRYITINPITNKASFAVEKIKNNIRSITIKSSESKYKCNPKSGKYYPKTYIYDPLTSDRLKPCAKTETIEY